MVFVITVALVLSGCSPGVVQGLQGCGGGCQSSDDCDGKLICIQGQCNDDPETGSSICRASGNATAPGAGPNAPPSAPDHDKKKKKKEKQKSGGATNHHTCDATPENAASCCHSGSCHKTSCSPPVTASTHAILTVNNFQAGGDGGATSECDQNYHSDRDQVVALSTGWFDKGSRCGKQIIIHGNGATTMATVVDECDSRHGCDSEHGGQPPCRNNIVDASDAVWQALGVSSDDDQLYGSMHITWKDA